MNADPGQSSALRHDPLTVLLVDDIQENIDLLQDILEEQGYRIVSTVSPLEALKIAQGTKIHMIVADAMMPKMDGLELCKHIRRHDACATTPFIIYTGNYVDQEDEDLARSIGVDRYVMKFAGTQPLVDAINELARSRYEHESAPSAGTVASIDDRDFLERHHDLMTKKLEEKMIELELYTKTLEQKNRELIISEKRYRSLFENASVAIFVADSRQRRIVDANRQALALLRCAPHEFPEVLDIPFRDANGEPIDIFALQRSATQEATLITRSGERLDVDMSAGPVDQPNDTRVMLFVRDITESKRIRDHLLQTEKMALMGRLAAGIAHEIRNPLAGIQLNLQYLSMKVPVDSPDLQSIEAGLEGTQRIQQVIDDTLGLARVAPPTLQEVSINEVTERSLRYLAAPSRQKGVTLDAQLGGHLPPVWMDAKQIQQVLLNLLQNAIDASPVEGVVTVTTRLCPECADPSVQVVVRDRGPGLAPDIAQHLFDGFRTTKEGGTGLGLMLSKFIIDRHHGQISIANAPDGGTVASIVFPTTQSARTTTNA